MMTVDIEELFHDEEGRMLYRGRLFDGTAVEYWPNGRLAGETSFKDGIEEGWSREWYEDGVLRDETFYRRGRVWGVRREWHPDGSLKLENTVEDGVCLRGREWDEHGNLTRDYVSPSAPAATGPEEGA